MTDHATTHWKILTHDRRPPIQGGKALCDGTTWPVVLPEVRVDTSYAECGMGWNSVADLAAGLRIAGLWSTGRPSRVLVVEPTGTVVTRGDKTRSSGLTLLREATEAEVRAGVEALSVAFGAHAAVMADEQMAWRHALARPGRDEAAGEAGLREAMRVRGLSDWTLRRYDTTRDARAVRDAWAAWAAWAVRDAWAAWAVRDAWAAWAARDAWAAWDARAVRDAWAALTVRYASLMGWVDTDLTTGIRDAYAAGLGVVLPVAPGVLGWAMDEEVTHD